MGHGRLRSEAAALAREMQAEQGSAMHIAEAFFRRPQKESPAVVMEYVLNALQETDTTLRADFWEYAQTHLERWASAYINREIAVGIARFRGSVKGHYEDAVAIVAGLLETFPGESERILTSVATTASELDKKHADVAARVREAFPQISGIGEADILLQRTTIQLNKAMSAGASEPALHHLHEARRHVEDLLSHDPEQQALHTIIPVMIEVGARWRDVDTVEWARQVRLPETAEAFANRDRENARILANAHRHDLVSAVTRAEAFIRDNPKSRAVRTTLAGIFRRHDSLSGARQLCEEALALQADDPIALCELSRVIMREAEKITDPAQRLLKLEEVRGMLAPAAVHPVPDMPMLEVLGDVLKAMAFAVDAETDPARVLHYKDEQIEILRKLQELRPGHALLWYEIARTQRQAVFLDPDSAGQSDRLKAARQCIRMFTHAKPLDGYGWREAAKIELELARRADDPNAKRVHGREAARCYTRARQLNPDDPKMHPTPNDKEYLIDLDDAFGLDSGGSEVAAATR